MRNLYNTLKMKNILKLLAWFCGAIGIVVMIIGSIAVLSGGILWMHRWSNYFYLAYNFITLGIFFFLATLVNREPKS